MPSIVLLQRDNEASPHLAALIGAEPGFEVVAVIHTVDEAQRLVRERQPEILVTDVRVQDGEVHAFLRELRQQGGPRPHVLATLVSQDEAAVLRALRAGADGYWVHASPPELLIETLGQMTRGESPVSPTIARQLLSYFEAEGPAAGRGAGKPMAPPTLSGTEREILRWVARGYLIDEIARQRQASVHSLARGVRRVYRKLQFDLQAGGLFLV